jgi:hypothetical protein
MGRIKMNTMARLDRLDLLNMSLMETPMTMDTCIFYRCPMRPMGQSRMRRLRMRSRKFENLSLWACIYMVNFKTDFTV